MHWMRMPVQYQDVIQTLFAFRPTTEADTNHGLGCAFHFFPVPARLLFSESRELRGFPDSGGTHIFTEESL